MRSRSATALALLAALHLVGGHWFAIQSVAWVTMIFDHSQDSSLVEAVSKTFDGQNQCPMCKAVAAGQKKERDQQEKVTDPSQKLMAVLAVHAPAPLPAFSELTYFPVSVPLFSVDGALPSPPPRAI